MKKMLFLLFTCGVITISACKSKSGSNSAEQGGNSGGASETPAKSNLDTMNDSAKMPAHVKADSVPDTTKK